MQLRALLRAGILISALPSAWAASGWGFDDATVSIAQKGAGVGSGLKEKLLESKPLSKPLSFGESDILKLSLTTREGSATKRPHQAFLLLKEPESGLDLSYPLTVKESGKGKLELAQKELPAQFLRSSKPIDASIVIASFGSARGYDSRVFQLDVTRKDAASGPLPSEALRYGKREEIHHIFKADPKSPSIVITLVFVGAVLAALPTLAGLWLYLGANLNHLPVALKSSPISHFLFLGSIVGLEGIFFLYYTTWNLFQTLPAALAVGAIAFVSGSRALSEVQERRLAGLR
ncbi:oligosaccharyltransferase complex subunit delta (ribophorin II) [Blastomyces parvus]|uniref:Oligosaccharyltransferase complex subunit delta (Ribophorin II) n=1 Tax=Blastomyces parvus TaxID=2060905 RepID=A0A2B7XNW1_9EURO|nr:oligosaccharyltransferase complex subunit delta (ribophorin II) [Blastomyces parvus]